MITGCGGLLTDYPSQGGAGLTEADVRQMELRPTIAFYPAESVINFKTIMVGGKAMLSLVVLREYEAIPKDEYEDRLEVRYRVLRFDEKGFYIQQVFDQDGKLVGEPIIPLQGNGARWEEIPFKLTLGESPLYDLAMVNIAHYRNSADHEENLYIHGQGTLFINPGEMTAEQFNEANPDGVQVGSRRGHVLGNGGSADMLQIEANSAVAKAMDDKEAQMIMLGARLITIKAQNQTAEAARIAASGEHSVLSDLVGNASEMIEASLEFAAIFAGADPEKVTYQLNDDFWDVSADPSTIMSSIQLLDRQVIAKSDFRTHLRKVGWLEQGRTDEDIDEEVEQAGGF
jgi:hypothetical protein